MPAKSPEAKARKSKRHEERRRVRCAADPDFRRKLNKQRNANHIERGKRYRAALLAARYFVGCDGEGSRDENGRSIYGLFRMGDRELYRGGARLTTPELLAFIAAHPDPSAILVGFFFEYDISNILFDVPSARDPANPDRLSRLERILQVNMKAAGKDGKIDPNPHRFGGWTALHYDGHPTYGVRYIPRNYLSVCRLAWRPRKRKHAYCSVPGSIRTIYDTQGFFQTTFLKALRQWRIGAEHWEKIAEMKDARASFTLSRDGITPEIRNYCRIECDLLATMMEAFRSQCVATDMVPATWNGAGKIASALLKRHNTLRCKRLLEITPAEVIDYAHAAYYGGRFEVTAAGWINRFVTEHDINSAYPSAMLDLPCFEHGSWAKLDGAGCASCTGLFIARGRFSHPKDQFLCGLPLRSSKGKLSWPREGNGVYWSVEIRSAERLGATFHYEDGWHFIPSCSCRTHSFVGDLYEKRHAIDRATGDKSRGIPIKLGLNSIYGKKAQRVGKPTFANVLEAGLITAITRAKINDAIHLAGNPIRVVMIATDGIYTTGGPIEGLDQGDGLGQWEVKRIDGMFIVRPGLYWPRPAGTPLGAPREVTGALKLKSRGISPKFFEPLIPAFERVWLDWMDGGCVPMFVPKVPVPVTTFVGVRLAARRGDPSQSCQWVETALDCRFTWADKRRKGCFPQEDCVVMRPLPGAASLHSHHYDREQVLASSTIFEVDRMLFEAQPDPLDLGPPLSEVEPLPDEEV